MKIEKVCPCCSMRFFTVREDKIFCSEQCQTRQWKKEHKTERYEQQLKWRKENPEKLTEYRRKTIYKRHGITSLEFEKLVTDCNGCCAICETKEPQGMWNTWNIDHDHITGRIRGILCHFCNVALGHFKDDEKLLLKAVAYLKVNAGDN